MARREPTGAERIAAAFAAARKAGRAALIPFVTAGVPTLEALPDLLGAVAQAGADLIEVGLPFSDPLADGPVLQRAATWALERGTRVDAVFAALRTVAPHLPPLVLLTYVNLVLRRGMTEFVQAAQEAGISGLIVPDLPWAESDSLRQVAKRGGLALIPLVAPTSTDRHLKDIAGAKGFVYGVSVTGVTGPRQAVDPGVAHLVARVRAEVALPVAVGFGIASPAQARAVGAIADGVIVGSALMSRILDHPDSAVSEARHFVAELRRAVEA
ncbi:MAG: tryptophan synthase subunit alpha [Firmicutes bacterium]|nr:tryptophan synthase subunit alpha [Alicyclobacillaceae bacterium]MCL6496414.1 tryptophan synthase subunit alpha [Bacillota bacterium]